MKDVCVEFYSNSSPNLTRVSKQGNNVYSLGKWVCFIKYGVMVLTFKPGYSVLAIEKNCKDHH